MNQLTWHEGLIAEDEIWLKLGGDKGGSSVKASFQIVNVNKPNSVRNSCVFAVFEAPDSVFNLHLALDQYCTSVAELQKTKWRFKITDMMTLTTTIYIYLITGNTTSVFSCQVTTNSFVMYMEFQGLAVNSLKNNILY